MLIAEALGALESDATETQRLEAFDKLRDRWFPQIDREAVSSQAERTQSTEEKELMRVPPTRESSESLTNASITEPRTISVQERIIEAANEHEPNYRFHADVGSANGDKILAGAHTALVIAQERCRYRFGHTTITIDELSDLIIEIGSGTPPPSAEQAVHETDSKEVMTHATIKEAVRYR